ncbi:MAG: hypothetical protein AABX39_06490 [Nanoarchaeota archaeon]
MYIPKKYGQGKIDKCPFCQKQATIINSQNIPVCSTHKEEELDDLKCLCGDSLAILQGKFGVFFSCIRCGNMNLKKVIEINSIKVKNNGDKKECSDNSKVQKTAHDFSTKKDSTKTIITVRSDDPIYFD